MLLINYSYNVNKLNLVHQRVVIVQLAQMPHLKIKFYHLQKRKSFLNSNKSSNDFIKNNKTHNFFFLLIRFNISFYFYIK